MCSRRLSSALVTALVAVYATAHADDSAAVALSPRVTATVTNGQEALEAGLEYTIGQTKNDSSQPAQNGGDTPTTDESGPQGRGRVFATLSKPFGSGTVVRIDKNSSDWRLKLGGDLVVKDLREPTANGDADLSWARYGFALSLGHAAFDYFPGAAVDPSTESHWSLSGTASAIWVHARRNEKWAPQIALTYDRTYAASPAFTVVGPPVTGMAGLVSRTIPLAPPDVRPAFVARASLPFALWPSSQILLGPSASHTFSGRDREMLPSAGGSGRIEGELWIYYFPNQKGLTNVRLGFSPFVSVRTYGDDQMDRTSFGALAELRITTELYEY